VVLNLPLNSEHTLGTTNVSTLLHILTVCHRTDQWNSSQCVWFRSKQFLMYHLLKHVMWVWWVWL